jgi:hypothetical protein
MATVAKSGNASDRYTSAPVKLICQRLFPRSPRHWFAKGTRVQLIDCPIATSQDGMADLAVKAWPTKPK